MAKKKKRLGEITPTQQPIIVQSGGGSLQNKLIVAGVLGVGAWFGIPKLIDYYKKGNAENKLDTPEGQIALQLKNVFDSTPVDDQLYKQVMQQVTPANSDQVRKIYQETTGRFLSDDEAKHINADTQVTAAKQNKINNTPGTLIKIENDTLSFTMGVGSLVRFPPGQKTGINLYLHAEDIATGATPAASLPPNSKLWKVSQVKLVPLTGIKLRKDWHVIFAPVTPFLLLEKTSKEFAAIQIGFGTTFLWANATDFRLWNKALTGFSGLSGIAQKLL